MNKLFLTVMALGLLLSFGQIQKAEARVYFGVNIGVGPAYVYPRSYYVAPYYPHYYVQRPVYYGPTYVAPQPYYYYPRYGYGYYYY